ncbi:uncharacterized protein DSM5745_08559 [Aspergillus mulundensis]|uniref:Uncharacterized protein n=1 Tax=Aspergillus mulundensis TaxID=1810919 RepID=A0A3D8R458_9EURO|nr:hypothetical protein DSM5745_08559 [Aspergillus mulundensis]RDW68799.1 hypothetical protein DSM5745_08559 [Aspergillus mulundensis]
MTNREIKALWAGRLPPDPDAGTHPIPPNGTNAAALAMYTRRQLLRFMEDPAHAVAMFDEGSRRWDCWTVPRVPSETTETGQAAWYDAQFRPATAGLGGTQPARPHTRQRIYVNIASLNVVDPIQKLIARGKLHALAELKRRGRWEPSGYTIDGESYLTAAWGGGFNTRTLVFHYIAWCCRQNREWAIVRNRDCPSIFSGSTFESNLDLLICKDYRAFSRLWTALSRWSVHLPGGHEPLVIPGLFGPATPRLSTESLAILAEKITGAMFHSLRRNNGLDLVDHNNQLAKFNKLLAAGANADLFLRSADGLRSLPYEAQRKWRFIAAAVRMDGNIDPVGPVVGGGVWGGTLHHVIVAALETKIQGLNNSVALGVLTAQHAAARRYKRYEHARRLIRLVRAGNGAGVRPNLATLDVNGATAQQCVHDVARTHGLRLHSIARLLE